MTEREIFAQAIEIQDARERPEFLDSACRGDAALRERIEALLAERENLGSYLEAPAAGREMIARAPVPRTGTRIGPYKLLQELGQGGMGAVYLAEQQEPVKRQVALKIIKAGMDSAQVIARFEQERQALAIMDHPHIAKVLDAGATDEGRLYFVMELVKGIPITRYCDQEHLSPKERLELFIPVCQAVQHAHQKGIIHRDLKPSNVLIALYDGRPVPKVIDFGVAKATSQKLTERTLFTEVGSIVGTLEYMAPEQAELNNLDIDTRADIYSLGVLLYELLTGAPPFSGQQLRSAGFSEMLRMIKEVEPPKPSTKLSSSAELPSIAANRKLEPARLTKLVRGDLDWIVMKCLEKERARRYETASGFARDIERFLHDEPVEAGRPSSLYRLRKLARKHRGILTTASMFVVLLVVGATLSAWQAVRAKRSEAAARASEKQAREAGEAQRAAKEQALMAAAAERVARQEAQAASLAERAAKDSAIARETETNAVLDFVTNQIFAAARPQGQAGGLGHDVTMRKALEAALTFVDKSFEDQPLIEARLRTALGTSFGYLGEAQTAAKQHEIAGHLYAEHRGQDDPDTLRSMGRAASSYFELGRHDDAVKLQTNVLALLKKTLGAEHPDTLTIMNNLANSYAALGREAEALALSEETLTLQKAKLGAEHPSTLLSMSNVAVRYAALGRKREALALHEETLALRKAKLGAKDPNTLISMFNVATGYAALGRFAEAAKLNEETLSLQKTILGPDHPRTLQTMTSLGNNYSAIGRKDEALKIRTEVLAIQKTKLGSDHADTLSSTNNLANSYADLGRQEEALALHEETLTLRKAKLGAEHPDTLTSMINVASRYNALRRHDEALKLYQETLALYKAKLGPDHPNTLRSMRGLALALANSGRIADATALFEQTLPLCKSKLGVDDPDTLTCMHNLAANYGLLGRYSDAVQLNEETLGLRKLKLGPSHPDTLRTASNLAGELAALDRHEEALHLHEDTLVRRREKLGPGHPETLKSQSGVAQNLVALGRGAEALSVIDDCFQRAKTVDARMIPALLSLRLRHSERQKDALNCQATATMWESLNRTDANSLYVAARMRAVATAVMRSATPSESANQEADAEADRAMERLRQAVAAGYKNAAQIAKEADFDSLRGREDFQQMVSELGKLQESPDQP